MGLKMTTEFSCYACNGLIDGAPVAELAAWLNAKTPKGIHFNEVGGIDPQIFYDSIKASVVADIHSGKEVIFIGHSYGAMTCYYLADDLFALGLKAPLFVPIDPTCWASNLPGTWRWGLSPSDGGQWSAPSNVTTWINYHQPYYPGGGVCISGGRDIPVSGCDHLSIPNTPTVRNGILSAINNLLGRA